jgi:triacylglycerol lipase
MPNLIDLRTPATYEKNPLLFLNQAIFLAKASEMAYEEDAEYAKNVLEVTEISSFPQADELNARTKGIFFSQDDVSVLSFQGSYSAYDWGSNSRFDVQPFLFKDWGNVHTGFYSALLDCLTSVVPKFIESSGSNTIWLTGHSRGGAVALLAAAYIQAKYHLSVNVMTYGQPMVGTFKFCETYNQYLRESTIRFIAQRDVVPSLPAVFYRHCGKPKKIKRDAVLEGFGTDRQVGLSIDDEEATVLDQKEAENLMDRLSSLGDEPERRGVQEGFTTGKIDWLEAHRMVNYTNGLESIIRSHES